MAYRSRLQRIQEKRNFTKAIWMFLAGFLILMGMAFYGLRALATLAIFIDKVKYGNKTVDTTDNIPPVPPTIWSDYAATNSAQVKIWGNSEPNSTVSLKKNDVDQMEATTDNNGQVDFGDVYLDPGQNEFSAVAEDTAGNKSHPSQILEVYYGNKNPDLSLDKPNDGQSFGKADNPIEIRGKTSPNAKVWVNSRMVPADDSGNFVMKYNLSEGDNDLKIRAIDTAGNETDKEIKVTFQP